MNIGPSSYHWCDVEKCATPREHVSPRRYPSYDATVAPYEDNGIPPETDFGFGQSFGSDRPTGPDDYSMQIIEPSTTSTYKIATTTTTTSTTSMRRTISTTGSVFISFLTISGSESLVTVAALGFFTIFSFY